jgi:hypothetical protein
MQGRMAALAGLNAGLLVGAEDVVLGTQGLALPRARIEVQKRPSFVCEVGITRKDPVLIAPRFDRIRLENPPYRAATDRLPQPSADPCRDVGQGLPAQRLLGFCDQFTSDCLNQRVVQRGKKRPCGPGLACPPGTSPPGPSGGATVERNTDAAALVVPPRCGTPGVVETRAKLGRPVAAAGTAPFFGGQSFQLPPRMVMRTQGGGLVGDHAWEPSFG